MNMDWSCCTTSMPCDIGGGDCDYDSDCMAGLTCGHDVGMAFGVSTSFDVCTMEFASCKKVAKYFGKTPADTATASAQCIIQGCLPTVKNGKFKCKKLKCKKIKDEAMCAATGCTSNYN